MEFQSQKREKVSQKSGQHPSCGHELCQTWVRNQASSKKWITVIGIRIETISSAFAGGATCPAGSFQYSRAAGEENLGYLSTSVDKPCWNKRAAGAKFCDLCTIMCDFPITKSHWRLPGSQNFPLRGLRDTATFFPYCCLRVDHLKKKPLLVDFQNNKGGFFRQGFFFKCNSPDGICKFYDSYKIFGGAEISACSTQISSVHDSIAVTLNANTEVRNASYVVYSMFTHRQPKLLIYSDIHWLHKILRPRLQIL